MQVGVMEIRTILLAILHIESIRELHLLPASEGIQSFLAIIAIEVDYNMYQELIKLIMTRRQYLEQINYFDKPKEN